MSVGENTEMNLSGNASFGYSSVFGESVVESSAFVFGGDADLTGYYYHPQFLSFRVNPYYNRSWLNSSFQSVFGAKGVNASANLFGGSHTPMSVSFEKGYNSEGQFGVPGSPGIVTRGDSQAFNVSAGAAFDGFPSVTAAYGISSNSYDLIGSETRGSGSGRVFSLGSAYVLEGFNLSATYTNSRITQNLPLITNLDERLDENTYQNTTQFTVSRHLFDSANFGANFNRTHFTTDYTGTPTDQTYDSFSSYVDLRPLKRLTLALSMNYTTNYSAYLLGSVALPQDPAGAVSKEYSSSYLEYGARAQYTISKHWTADGGVDRRSQSFLGVDLPTNTANGGLGYQHPLLGGQFSGHYGVAWYSADAQDQSAVGHSTSVSYSRDFLGWRNGGEFQYARRVQTAIFDYTQSGYGFGFNTSRRLGHRFNLALGAHMVKSTIDGVTSADSLMRTFNASVSTNKLSFSSNYSRSSGNALQFGNGLIPTPTPGQILLPDLLVRYSGSSYSFGSAYHPTRHFQISGTYAHARYRTDRADSVSDSLLYRFDVKSEYTFRQLRFLAGYAHITQGVGATFSNPATVNSVYVGVYRHFDVF